MPWSSRYGDLKWGQGRWSRPRIAQGTNWTGAFEADGKATLAIGNTTQKFAARFECDGTSPSNAFTAHLKMTGQLAVHGICSLIWTSHQKFVGAFQIERRDQLWKRYLNGLAVDGFPTDWDGGQRYWKDGLPTDWINNIPEVVFFQGFKGKDFKYYYNGLLTDGINQDGSQFYWKDGLAFDYIDTPVTNEASIIINGQASMNAATRQAFAARFNIGGKSSVQFGTQMAQVGRFTAAGKGGLTINKTNSSMLAKFVCNGLATVTFISGVGSVKITCVDTGVIGSGPSAPAISFLYDAPYSY